MSRCQHCNKLTHSEDLNVYFDSKDFEKVHELQSLINWTHKYQYDTSALEKVTRNEYGKLKCGDIYIHFIQIEKENVR